MPCCHESPRADPSRGAVRSEFEVWGKVPRELEGYPVWLHVYELGPAAAPARDGRGGALHCGVEVVGQEHGFETQATKASGCRTYVIRRSAARGAMSHPRHAYRKSVFMGLSPLGRSQIRAVLQASHAWPSRCCTDFAAHLIEELQVPEPLPAFLSPAPHAGAKVLPEEDVAGPGSAPTPSRQRCRRRAPSPEFRHPGSDFGILRSCVHVLPSSGAHEAA